MTEASHDIEAWKVTDHTVHIGLCPDDIMVMVDHHRPAEDMEVLHNIFLNICQCRHMCVVAWKTHSYTQQYNLQIMFPT